MKPIKKYTLTLIVVLIALFSFVLKYKSYVMNPWTRNGQVQAKIIQITPRVSGPIVALYVKDNQFVRAGELLYKIDPRTYLTALAEAEAKLHSTRDNVKALEIQINIAKSDLEVAKTNVALAESQMKEISIQIPSLEAEFIRQQKGITNGSSSQKDFDTANSNYKVILEEQLAAQSSLDQATANVQKAYAELEEAKANLGLKGNKNAEIQSAMANLEQAKLNVEFTEVRASVDGFITNFNLQVGSHMVQNQPSLALVDSNSYWVYGFFKETSIKDIKINNKATVTLMAYGNTPLNGYVESIGWGISQTDGSTGNDLLPSINPTFDWIRLAQRIPVRIHLSQLPANVSLRVGATASVMVETNQFYQTDAKGEIIASPLLLR
ncbi:HlyD family secretion protein [Flammeovirga kamogawensis]|uniref:HlyD family secretion protein n=1 Tax=Flammeovirga kamogawensis TaxID=373891 RepID=A0ABX8H329_9BACT|nr:HlyD family secretion protein [Flammeovirga kamogawensis]MBB6463589.1 multidrug resistance efflux pump [Flammeovirga kamogawensis]QWG09816.1 HlyD family secretion protein [Flammeovirga kamogawensis]TRX65324.1 HlyD family secretion protein [Flammeovirga kamogawensis]